MATRVTGLDGAGSTGVGGRRHYPHGATTRPILARPGNGYGRLLRPGPDVGRAERLLDESRAPDVARTGDPRG